MTVQCTHTTAD